jgi:hypothetical protein
MAMTFISTQLSLMLRRKEVNFSKNEVSIAHSLM